MPTRPRFDRPSSAVRLKAQLSLLLLPLLAIAACVDRTDPLSPVEAPEARTVAIGAVTEAWPAPPTSWADVYDPFVLRSLNVQISADDWATIRNDETFDIKVPATFWLDGDVGDARYDISIRRKSATPIGDKISYRVKFEQQVGNSSIRRWYDIRSLSLENGDDADVVREGLSWYLHRLASTETYQPGLAAWATLTLHLEQPVTDESGQLVLGDDGEPLIELVPFPQGVYLNVELPDKQFLRHRGLWSEGSTWLYKQDDIGLPELKEPDIEAPTPEESSPAYRALAYSPFEEQKYTGKRLLNPPPSDADLEADLQYWVDMDGMLRLGAVNAYTDNPDELFNKGKNFFWVDFVESRSDHRRRHFPWDLDASIRTTTGRIYSAQGGGKKNQTSQHPFQEVILNHPVYREQFNTTFLDLLNGPMSVATVHSALDQFEALLSESLVADPNSKIQNPAGHFASLRSWISDRTANVRSQIAVNGPPAPRPSYGGGDLRTVHLGSLTGVATAERRSWTVTVTAGVVDDTGAPVADAVVAAQWSGATTGAITCSTGTQGNCTMTASGLKSNQSSVTLTVNAISGTNLTYDPNGNTTSNVVEIARP